MGTPTTAGEGLPAESRPASDQKAAAAEPSSEGASSAGPSAKPRGKDPLLAGICHDLRAPLAAVSMGANFVLQTTPENEASGRSRRVLQAVIRSCKQMERLIRDFGDLSEVEGEAVELRLAVQDAGQMLELAAESARPSALERNIEITTTLPEKPILFHCDRDRVLRALAHVIDNAVRFSPDGEKMSLVLGESDGEVRFEVIDKGPGISDEVLDHLYDRVWLKKRPDRSGAGLGLGIARGFVRAHGGRIDVDTRPGRTRMVLVLPREIPVPAPDVAERH